MPMANDILYNIEGYVDPTAFEAISNYIKKERIKKMDLYRGDIVEIINSQGTTKTALVVSANFRIGGRYLSIIILRDDQKGAVNVPISTKGSIMYADCGLVSFCSLDNVVEFTKSATTSEMQKVNEGIIKCFGLDEHMPPETVNDEVNMTNREHCEGTADDSTNLEIADLRIKLANAVGEANAYKALYDRLLEKVIK